jgi:hypothetical protein
MDERPLQYCKFVIDEKPYCLWDWDLKDRTISFLEGVDPSYFTYLSKVHIGAIGGEHQQHAALAIRSSYAQALETLFAFLGAALQAPYCVPAWLTKYSNADLSNLITKLRDSKPIYSSFGHKIVKWEQISQLIHTNLVLKDNEREQLVSKTLAIYGLDLPVNSQMKLRAANIIASSTVSE